MLRSAAICVLVPALFVGLGVCQSTMAGQDQRIGFNQTIRPILADHCFSCHGPDANNREADLRLDRRDDATRDRDGMQVVHPGHPDSSELVRRIMMDDYERMPPEESGRPLTASEIEAIRSWIAEGAEWQEHWSLTPLKRPPVPTVARPDWVKNPIDGFILRRLEREELMPSELANQITLCRRLSFDLNGLPPSLEDVEMMVDDTSEAAYQRYVDQLISSPHFGERIAMYWLDLVRYADTLGYHGDQERSVSPYRDYVIRAFNSNMPFDRFTRENLAGDLLANATLDQRVASTYNRLNRASAEGGGQPKEYLAKYAADRVRTTGNVWLGVTLGCAECHDHKFDPFSTKDFYSFAAFFSDIHELGIVNGAKHVEQLPVPTPEQSKQLAQLEIQIQDAEASLRQETPDRVKAFTVWRHDLVEQMKRWRPIVIQDMTSSDPVEHTLGEEHVVSIIGGPNPEKNDYLLTGRVELDKVTALRLDVLADDALPAKGPGRAPNGNFVVQGLVVKSGDTELKWKSASATFSQDQYGVAHLAQGNVKGWAIMPQLGHDHQATLVAEAPLPVTDNTIHIKIVQQHGSQHTVGKFRLFARSEAPSAAESAIPRELAVLLSQASLSDAEHEQLWSRFVDFSETLAQERKMLSELRKRQEQIKKTIVTTLVTVSVKPREMRVLPRGNWMDESGEVVVPAVPQVLPQPQGEDRRLNRLDLADWLTDRGNPLVARVFVNRLWMLFYGNGLAPTVDDLGSRGAWPTHPELLDWLAVEFIESGWDVKHMVRLLVTSHTYRQSSRVTGDSQRKDPYNQLYARQSRWRLDAEMVRDNALCVSGLLVANTGGPSARPYQPAGYWAQLNFPKRKYQHDTGEGQYRRGLYTHWQRAFLHPSLLAFDAPAREECQARRDRSNTPLQALVLLNDPTYVEAARVFAERIVQDLNVATFSQRVDWAYRQLLSRAPRQHEITLLQELHDANLRQYRADPGQAEQLLGVGIAESDEDVDPVELAAWAATSRALFNLHEFLMRY